MIKKWGGVEMHIKEIDKSKTCSQCYFAKKEGIVEITSYNGFIRITKPKNPNGLYCSSYDKCVLPDDISCFDFIDRDE